MLSFENQWIYSLGNQFSSNGSNGSNGSAGDGSSSDYSYLLEVLSGLPLSSVARSNGELFLSYLEEAGVGDIQLRSTPVGNLKVEWVKGVFFRKQTSFVEIRGDNTFKGFIYLWTYDELYPVLNGHGANNKGNTAIPPNKIEAMKIRSFEGVLTGGNFVLVPLVAGESQGWSSPNPELESWDAT